MFLVLFSLYATSPSEEGRNIEDENEKGRKKENKLLANR